MVEHDEPRALRAPADHDLLHGSAMRAVLAAFGQCTVDGAAGRGAMGFGGFGEWVRGSDGGVVEVHMFSPGGRPLVELRGQLQVTLTPAALVAAIDRSTFIVAAENFVAARVMARQPSIVVVELRSGRQSWLLA